MTDARSRIASLRYRLPAIVLLGAIVPLALTGWWITRSTVQAFEDDIVQRLDIAVSDVAAEIDRNWLARRSSLLDIGDAVLSSPSDRRPVMPSWCISLVVEDASGSILDSWTGTRPFGTVGAPILERGVPVHDSRTGARVGSIRAEFPITALIDPSSVLTTTPGAVLGVFDLTTGASFLPLPLSREQVASDGFRIGDIRWRSRARIIDGLSLRATASAPVSIALAPLDASARDGLRVLILVTIGIIVVVSMLVRPILVSIDALTHAAEAVSRGDFEREVPTRGGDEVARLGRSFNRMTATLRDTLKRLGEREGFAAVGEFAASLSHDIRNALTSIRLDLQLLGERLPEDESLRRIQRRALARSTRLGDTVTAALDLARSGNIERALVDLVPIVEQSAESVRSMESSRPCTIRIQGPIGDPVRLAADRAALGRLLTNLLLNAVQASDSGSEVIVEIMPVSDQIQVDVVDRGSGIPEDLRSRAFEPLVTGRPDGTGMGLAIAARIARSHGGALDIAETGPEGTRVRLVLPR